MAPLVRAVFQFHVGSDSQGSLVVHTPDQQSHRCLFTSKTYFERDQRRTSISRIEPGQTLEILSERTPEPPRCRALIVRVITPELVEKRTRARHYLTPTEAFAPRGNLVLTGIVVKADHSVLVLRTRQGERHTVQLRRDTRFLKDGLPASSDQLPLHQPLQIRAGKTYDNSIEAFSIVWGEILQPSR